MLLSVKETGPLDVNTYILKDEISKEAVIIDVGGCFDTIKNEIETQGYKIKFILNTHGHFDHVFGEPFIQQNYPDIPIYLHKDDLIHIKRLKDEMKFYGIFKSDGNLTINHFIDENSELFIGQNKIKILHTPGHSKGSLSFYIDNKLFCGDTLFYRSIGRTDFYDGDYDTLINSIKTKMFNLPDDTLVFPGHGISTTIKAEKQFNEYLK